MPYWRAFYHLVWSTKHRVPLLTRTPENEFIAVVRELCQREGWILHAYGIVPDHVHLVMSVAPKFAIADVVRQIKIHSNHRINAHLSSNGETVFEWQTEYGMFTFSDVLYSQIVAYVVNQKDHHAMNTLDPNLERTDFRTGRAQ